MSSEKVVGIDLAGLPKNDTGFCELKDKKVNTCKLKTDKEIIHKIKETNPKLIAIDGPLKKPAEGNSRQCDRELREYGSLPPLMSNGMEKLTKRAIKLYKDLNEENYIVIEVSCRATAQILRIDRKKENKVQKQFIKMNLKGTVENRVLSIDEVDAVLAALTAKLHLQGKTETIGGTDGFIVIPKR